MRLFSIASAALCCGACSVPLEPSPRDAGVALPAHWSTGETVAGRIEPDWWTQFDDPALGAVIEEALGHNRDLQAAAARLYAAAAAAKIAGADLWPQLGASLDAQRARVNFIGLPLPGSQGGVTSFTTSTYGVSLDLSWELDLWGRIRAGELAATADVEAAAAELRGAELSIAGQTARAWFAVTEAGQQLRLAEDTAANYRRSAELVRRRFEAGVRPPLDLRLALTDQSAAQALVEQRRALLEAQSRQLETLLGRYPDGAVDTSLTLPVVRDAVPAGIPAELLARRPDLCAAERRLLAADARLAEARTELYPRISLTASGGTASADVKDLLDFDFGVWSFGANLLAPLFLGGRLSADVDLHDALRLEVVALYGGAVLEALREVETALSQERILAAEEVHRVVEVQQATAARRLSEDRYGRGLEDIVTMLAAQRRALDAESQLLALRRRRLDTRVDLLLALGGGYRPAAPETEETEAAAR